MLGFAILATLLTLTEHQFVNKELTCTISRTSMAAQSEHQLQSICIQYFKDKFPDYLMWASLNGIKLSGKDKYGTINKEKQAGFLKGVPDTTVCLPDSITLHIEFKTVKGKQSPEQVAVEAKLEAMGHYYHIIKTFTEFKELINQYITE